MARFFVASIGGVFDLTSGAVRMGGSTAARREMNVALAGVVGCLESEIGRSQRQLVGVSTANVMLEGTGADGPGLQTDCNAQQKLRKSSNHGLDYCAGSIIESIQCFESVGDAGPSHAAIFERRYTSRDRQQQFPFGEIPLAHARGSHLRS